LSTSRIIPPNSNLRAINNDEGTGQLIVARFGKQPIQSIASLLDCCGPYAKPNHTAMGTHWKRSLIRSMVDIPQWS
jgi:hypothetical protein